MFSVLGAILAIGLLIVVHEAGHYFVARWCKMRVERFSIGFGPPILKWRRGETDFTLGPIPFGGFVQIRGMTVAEEVDPDDQRAYPNRPAWQRFAAIFAGPGTNYLFAIALALPLYAAVGPRPSTAWWTVADTQAGWPAEGVLQAGDQIVKLDGEPNYVLHEGKRYDSLPVLLAERKDRPVVLTVLRDGAERDVKIQAVADPEYLKGSIFEGIPASVTPSLYRLGLQLGVHEAARVPMGIGDSVSAALIFPVNQSALIGKNLFDIATGRQQGQFLGPVGITTMIKRTFDVGLVEVLELLMLLNVYLGLFNLLPLPALDGGRLVFLGYEMATRRRANPKIEAGVHMVGIMALLLLMVLVTYKDIARLF
jgi:regulator of sigma E protease